MLSDTHHIEKEKESSIWVATKEHSQPHTTQDRHFIYTRSLHTTIIIYLKVSKLFIARLTLCSRLSGWAESAVGSIDAMGRMWAAVREAAPDHATQYVPAAVAD